MNPRLPVSRWPSKGVLALIRAYKLTLSPFVGRDCRYLPTCSAYAADAVTAHGAWAGSWMAAARLCRCHPWGGSGYDPAPAVAEAPWWGPWRYGDWRLSSPARGGGGEQSEPEGASLPGAGSCPLSHHAARADSSPAGGGANSAAESRERRP